MPIFRADSGVRWFRSDSIGIGLGHIYFKDLWTKSSENYGNIFRGHFKQKAVTRHQISQMEIIYIQFSHLIVQKISFVYVTVILTSEKVTKVAQMPCNLIDVKTISSFSCEGMS